MTPVQAVRVGQVWRDLDPREDRLLTVMEVRPDGKVVVETNAGRQATIRLDRFRAANGRGYALVSG